MIRVTYIHEFDLYDECANEIDSLIKTTNRLYNEYEMRKSLSRSALYEDSDSIDYEDPYVVEAGKNFVEKIGAAVIGAVNKVVELINKFIENIKSFLWSKKTDQAKWDEFSKKHSDLAKQMKIASDKGDFNINDYKSLNELVQASSALIRKINSGSIEPSAAEKMFDGFLEKFEKGAKLFAIIGGVATAGISVYDFGKRVGFWGKKESTESKDLKNYAAEFRKLAGEVIKTEDELDKAARAGVDAALAKSNKIDTRVGAQKTISNIISTVTSKMTSTLNGHNKILKAVVNAANVIDSKLGVNATIDRVNQKNLDKARTKYDIATNRADAARDKFDQAERANALVKQHGGNNGGNNP